MKAEIITVGSELLTPDRMDTNSLFLTEELNKLGIEVVRKSIVGDNRDYLSAAFKEALDRVELVIASGGLAYGRRLDARDPCRPSWPKVESEQRNPAVHRRAIPAAWPGDAGGECAAGDGAGGRGGSR